MCAHGCQGTIGIGCRARQTKLRLPLHYLRESLAVQTNVCDDENADHERGMQPANSTMRALMTNERQTCDASHVSARVFLGDDRAFLRHAWVLGVSPGLRAQCVPY